MASLRSCRNPFLGGEDALAEAPIEGNSTPVIFRTPTPAPAQVPALTPAPVSALASAPGPAGRYTDEDLQRTTKLALE